MTPLHVAVRRGLVRTAIFLIQNGGDVNAVAEGDCMPLTLAEELEASSSDKETIIDVLLKRYVVC
jgi:Ankyrin repeat